MERVGVMLATVELDHGGARLDLEKKENFRRWSELCSELGVRWVRKDVANTVDGSI